MFWNRLFYGWIKDFKKWEKRHLEILIISNLYFRTFVRFTRVVFFYFHFSLYFRVCNFWGFFLFFGKQKIENAIKFRLFCSVIASLLCVTLPRCCNIHVTVKIHWPWIYLMLFTQARWRGDICTTERNKHHMSVHSMYFMQNYVMNVYNILKVIWPKFSRWSLYWEEFSFLKKRLQYLWKYLLSLNQTLSYIQTSRLFWP